MSDLELYQKNYKIKPDACEHASGFRRYARPRENPEGGHVVAWKCLACGLTGMRHSPEPMPKAAYTPQARFPKHPKPKDLTEC